jgi:O-antigen ligase
LANRRFEEIMKANCSATTWLLFSLLLGGIGIGFAGRTPLLAYFSVFLPLVFVFMLVWDRWPDFCDGQVFWLGTACIITQLISALANPQDVYKSLVVLEVFGSGLLFYAMLRSRPVPPAAVCVWVALLGVLTVKSLFSVSGDGAQQISAIKDDIDIGIGRSNFIASYSVLLLPTSVVMAYVAKGWAKSFYLACLSCGLTGFLCTFSRGAWLALIVASAVNLPLMRRSGLRAKHLIPIGVLSVVLVVCFPDALSEVYDYVAAKESVGDTGRIELWQKGVRIFFEHPLLGVGPGQIVNYLRDTDSRGSKLGTHNTYLEVPAELGLLGTGPLFALLAVVMYRVCKRARNSLDPLAVAGWTGLLAGMLHNIVENTFFTLPFQILFWVVVGLVWNRSREPNRATTGRPTNRPAELDTALFARP